MSDDVSTDRTFEIIQEEAGAYHGPHVIRLNRNETNLGIPGHINRLMELALGELIVIAAADDLSSPHRVESLYQAYLGSNKRAMSLHSSCILIDQADTEIGLVDNAETFATDPVEVVRKGTWVFGCTLAWHRLVFETFGPLPPEIQVEDAVVPFRSLLIGEIAYVREPLVRYRQRDRNMSRGHKLEGRATTALLGTQERTLWKEELETARSYWRDLQKGVDALDIEVRNDLARMIRRQITSCELEIFVRHGRRKGGLSLLYRAVRCRVEARRLAKLLLTLVSPALYSRRKHRLHNHK